MSNLSEFHNSLVGFLQKKSLFAGSPDKASKRRSTSRQFQQLKAQTPRNTRALDTQDEGQKSLRNLKIKKSQSRFVPVVEAQTNSQQGDFSPRESPIRYPDTRRANLANTVNPADRRKTFKNPEQIASEKNFNRVPSSYIGGQSKQVWAGITNHSSSFQSARIESNQCLQNLSIKLQKEISNINYKLDMFNSKMNTMINNQLKKLRQKIYEVVERAFAESQRSIRQFMKVQQENFAGELLKMREHLEKEYQHVESMKEDIKKPGWRKTAGELLSSELEMTIEEDLKRSNTIAIAHWEIGDIGANKIKSLEDHLKEIVKISR